MTSNDGIPVSLMLPDVPASSSSSVDSSDSISSVNEEQDEQETVPSTILTANHKCTKSIAHDDWVGRRSIIFHVDQEHHGGDACGVLQLSVVAYDPTGHKVVGEFDS
jgi:hypothetical protein